MPSAKRVLLLPLALFLITACQPSKEEMKADFIKTCEQGTENAENSAVVNDIYKKYCHCAADTLFAKLSKEELTELDKLPVEAMQERMRPYTISCTDQLTDDLTHEMTKNGNAQ